MAERGAAVSRCAVLLAALLFSAQALCAGSVTDEKANLQALRKRIEELKREMTSTRDARNSEQVALEKLEKRIGRLNAELRSVDLELAEVRASRQELQDSLLDYRERIAQTQQALYRELRAVHAQGRQERMRMLLSQDDPAVIGRMLTYQGYFARARMTRMQAYNEAVAGLRATQASLEQNQAELERLHSERARQQQQLVAEQSERKQLLSGLQRRLNDQSGQLGDLEKDEQRVVELVKSLQQALDDFPAGGRKKPLRTLKGKLRWPVPGRIVQHYGDQQSGGRLRSRGVRIATADGTPVRAIAHGRVVFADWLRGFGLLLILDHGDGFMSLYGQNESLYKDVGDWVDGGEVLAAAGNSGGRQQTGVYLELRKDGEPLDPKHWFHGRPKS